LNSRRRVNFTVRSLSYVPTNLTHMLKELSGNQRIAVSALIAIFVMVSVYILAAVLYGRPTLRPVSFVLYWLLYFPRVLFDQILPQSRDPFEPGPGGESAIVSLLVALLIYSFGIDALIARYVRRH
jgi:hypothetical protein